MTYEASMDEGKDSILSQYLTCWTPADMRLVLQAHMHEAPNVDLLHKVFHKAIMSDHLVAAELIANVILLVAKEPKTQWASIVTGSALGKTNKFSWAKYFADDIKRRKKKNEDLRNQSMLHLYKTKKLTIFKAKHYPKTLFTLFKLRADPLETQTLVALTLSLIKCRTMPHTSRLHILNYMAKNKLIRLGENGSPISLSLLGGRTNCVKYLLQDPGIEKVRIDGANVIEYLKKGATKALRYFSVPQLVKMLSQRFDGQLVAKRIDLTNLNETHNYYMALKEMAKDPKIAEELSKIEGISLKTLAFFNGTAKTFSDFSGNQNPGLSNTGPMKKFSGNTSFDLALLPAEMLEMVTVYLGAEDQARLFSVSKAIYERLSDYHWQHMLRYETPLQLYQQLELATKDSWCQRAAPRIRAANNWKLGKYVVKKLRTPKSPVRIHPRKLDEFWLASTMCGKLRLWNVNDGSGKIIKVSQDPMTVDYFSASPYTAPDVLFRTASRFGYWINNRLHEHEYGLLAVPNHEILLEKLDGHKLLISSQLIFDINRQRTFPIKPGMNFDSVQYNPFNNMIVAHAQRKAYILDKDFDTMAVSDVIETPKNSWAKIKLDIVDEYTVFSKHTGGSTLLDLRTMKPLLNLANQARCNGAGRAIEIDTDRTGIIWNLKTLTWESAVPLPNGTQAQLYEFVCNSKMAVFSAAVPFTLNATIF
jgi:hypothetical protein